MTSSVSLIPAKAGIQYARQRLSSVMAGFMPAIHVFPDARMTPRVCSA
jgi:hypothetical protein